MYVVAGVTGHTGSVVAATLQRLGKPVRVLVRNKEKGVLWKEQGAEVAVTSLDDAVGLRRALDGAAGLYYLIPPDLQSDDALEYAKGLIDVLHGVLAEKPIAHVAYLSSIGAQHVVGTGPIRGHHYAEQNLMALETPFTFVRAGYFMDNTASFIPVMREQGVLPSMFDPNKKIPMVASQDIGEVAAQALLEPPASTQIIELAGPVDYSLSDAAEAYSSALGRHVVPIRIPEEGIIPALKEAGFSDNIAGLFQEMCVGIEHGIVDYEGGTARSVRGSVTLDYFVQQRLAG
jgi:uncharacterized protein YbjT (DUF2867 family)